MQRTVDGVTRRRDDDCVRVTRTDSVAGARRVRHFDELDEPAQEAVAGLDAGATVCDAPELSSGEVIVYTDYYRVE